jgi:transmembrane sensor
MANQDPHGGLVPANRQEERFKSLPRRLVIGGMMAASVAGILIFANRSAEPTITTGTAEFRKVLLSDRSIAQLSSSSAISEEMTPSTRRVHLLAGEAWFDVSHNPARPFWVDAGNVRVRAVGTSFSVRRLNDGVEVIVSEGTVRIWNGEAGGTFRQATVNDIAFIPNANGHISVKNSAREAMRKLAWLNGNVVLDGQTLDEAVRIFNTYNTHQIVIVNPSIRTKQLVGVYRLDKPESFANDLTTLLNVTVRISDGTIYVG